MTALASTDVTVAISERSVVGRKLQVIGTIAFGDAALTYPTNGVPLPAIASFGFKRNMDALVIFGNNSLTTSYKFMYDKTNHLLLMYEEEATAAGGPLLECDTSEAPAAGTYDFMAYGW